MTGFRLSAGRLIIAAVAVLSLSTPSFADSLVSLISQHLGASRPSGCPSKWCACYLDKVLAAAGYKIRGSYRARDFAIYGEAVKPMTVGAIMVMPHHVGVVAGLCPDGRVQLLSGNYSRRVGVGCYSARKAIAWRAPIR